MIRLKYCPACEAEKSITAFDLDLLGLVDDNDTEWDGFLPLCRPCCQVYPFGYPEAPDRGAIGRIYEQQGGKCYKCFKPLNGIYSIRPFIGMGEKGSNAFKLTCSGCELPGDLRQRFDRIPSPTP